MAHTTEKKTTKKNITKKHLRALKAKVVKSKSDLRDKDDQANAEQMAALDEMINSAGPVR